MRKKIYNKLIFKLKNLFINPCPSAIILRVKILIEKGGTREYQMVITLIVILFKDKITFMFCVCLYIVGKFLIHYSKTNIIGTITYNCKK